MKALNLIKSAKKEELEKALKLEKQRIKEELKKNTPTTSLHKAQETEKKLKQNMKKK
jgi:hypothetical protein